MEYDLTPENIKVNADGSFVVRIVGGELAGMEYQTTPNYNPELFAQCCAALELDPEAQAVKYREAICSPS